MKVREKYNFILLFDYITVFGVMLIVVKFYNNSTVIGREKFPQ